MSKRIIYYLTPLIFFLENASSLMRKKPFGQTQIYSVYFVTEIT